MSEVIYYCTKYTTKDQQDAYCSVALALSSYRRRLEREKAGDNKLSEEEVSRKRVTGLMYTMTNSIEIAGPLAALYILRKSPCYRSHDFQSLPLDSIIKGFISCKENNLEDDFEQNVDLIKDISFSKDESKNNDEKSIAINESDSNSDSNSDSDSESENDNESDHDTDKNKDEKTTKAIDPFLDPTQIRKEIYKTARLGDNYIFRSNKFNNMTLYEFSCQIYKSKRKPNEKIIDQGFLEGHPLRDTHVLRKRKHEVIPIIYGNKLKPITIDSSFAEKEENSIIALVLHKPFRNPVIDLKGEYLTWHEAFTNWKPSPEINQYLLNAYDLHYARKRAGELSKENKNDSFQDDFESDSENRCSLSLSLLTAAPSLSLC